MESFPSGVTSVTSPVDSEMYDFPHPDFYDFDKIRCKECFSAGQIWALYDAPDAMPRFYGEIRKVFPSRVEFLVNWIVADPDGREEMEWVDSCLPASCGKFKSGNRVNVFDLPCFSHQVYPVEISDRGVFRIFPRKGSTWAVFKNWDIEWRSSETPDRRFEYEFVEVLSDYDMGFGLFVAFLGKVKGFVSVFCRIVGREMQQVPPGELLRFSHMIPSCQLTGEEGEGVPKDSFELDPLSLPKDIEEIVVEGFGLNVGKPHSSGQCSSRKVSEGIQSSSARDEDTERGFKEEAAKTDEQVSDAAAQNGAKEEHSPGTPGGFTDGNKETETIKESVEMNVCQKSSETCVDSPAEPDVVDYPNPDFNDFGKLRKYECFSVGQTWALYDPLDGMPRFYAQIRKVWLSKFKLRVTWLEAVPDGMNEIEWVKADLPTSCGKFKSGHNETISDRLSFSHQVYVVESSQSDSVKILPRKGSTWALFKNWDIKWKSHGMTGQKHKYEYEFVEVLTDYEEGVGVLVAFLGKVKGFVSVFGRISREGKSTQQIPPWELLRFSHMVPSFKVTGDEGEGVPKDSFELDPLSLPKNIEEITVEGFELNAGEVHTGGQWASSSSDNINVSEAHGAPSPSVNLGALKIPASEFFDFDRARAPENLQVGQVWALYCDEDGLPKYYASIAAVHPNKFEVKINWLHVWRSRDTVLWKDKAMPVGCGTFKHKYRSVPTSYTDTDAFSHRVTVKRNATGDQYTISPKKGEVWALYRNWSANLKVSGLKKCKYDVVEVLADGLLYTSGALLEKVPCSNSVFKPVVKDGGTALIVAVPRTELTRFSHQMPAFRLTDQKGGALRGFWEVDPAALPLHYFSMNM